jgi:hypothetical protein
LSAESLAEQHVREFTRACVPAGLLTTDELHPEVLQGVEDHWVAKQLLDDRAAAGALPRGVAWFTAPDVWHAVDEGMLEVNLWHGTTANAAPADDLLDDVLGVLEQHALAAHVDEGRIEVDVHWHRRIPR